jgi:hypothetical protein
MPVRIRSHPAVPFALLAILSVPPASAQVEAVVVRLEESRCFS